MIIDGIAVTLILLYGILGYRYGLTGALINLAGMVGGYVAAVMYARPAGMMLAERAGLAPLLALPIAGMLIFLLVTRVFYLLHLIVRKMLEGDKTGPSPLLTVDRVGGLAFGIAKGGVIVGFLIWGLPAILGSSKLAQEAGLAQSQAVGLVRSGIETAARWGSSFVVDDPNVQAVMARATADPRGTMQELAALAANPNLKACLQDPQVAREAKTQGLMAIVRSPSFANVLADPQFQKGLHNIGFAPPDGRAVTQAEVEQAVTAVNTKLMKQVDTFKSSASAAELQTFLADPAVQEKLKAGKVTEVLNDPRLTRLLGMAPDARAPAPPRSPPPDEGR